MPPFSIQRLFPVNCGPPFAPAVAHSRQLRGIWPSKALKARHILAHGNALGRK